MSLIEQSRQALRARAPGMFPKDEFIVDTGDEVSKARKFWLTCQAVDREFAQRSGLSVVGCDGIRRFRDYIVAPVVAGGDVKSVQVCKPGKSKMWPGISFSGCAHVLIRPRAAITCVTASIMPALAIFQSMRMANVVCSFDDENAVAAASNLGIMGSVVFVASSRDTAKLETQAAKFGAGFAKFHGIEGCDAADALREWGAEGSHRIIRALTAAAKYVHR